MVGTRLLPLNQLKTTHPHIYELGRKKYEGREKLLERKICALACLWNDVVHFSAVNPRHVFDRLEERGFGPYRGSHWYKVPTAKIRDLKAVVFYPRRSQPSPDFRLNDADIAAFDSACWTEPTALSADTLDYFTECKTVGRPPMLFQGTPHILVLGQVDVGDCAMEVY